MVGAVGDGVARAANDPQVTLGNLLALLADDHGVPVAPLVRGLAQLTGKGELGLALHAEEPRHHR